eukprot:1160611-Pelagomonas_calceolata.AAC.9
MSPKDPWSWLEFTNIENAWRLGGSKHSFPELQQIPLTSTPPSTAAGSSAHSLTTMRWEGAFTSAWSLGWKKRGEDEQGSCHHNHYLFGMWDTSHQKLALVVSPFRP